MRALVAVVTIFTYDLVDVAVDSLGMARTDYTTTNSAPPTQRNMKVPQTLAELQVSKLPNGKL